MRWNWGNGGGCYKKSIWKHLEANILGTGKKMVGLERKTCKTVTNDDSGATAKVI